MNTINKIQAREILDSRGNPTIETDITLDNHGFGRASVPSGASTGTHEAHELRDLNSNRYKQKGVVKAVDLVNTELSEILSEFTFDPISLDKHLINYDGTKNKSKLGANTILSISLAFAKAVADGKKQELFEYFHEISNTKENYKIPVPMMNILNGGKHAENSMDLQEFMIVPVGAPSFKEALRYSAEIFHELKQILSEKSFNTCVGDEGGFAPSLEKNEDALELIMEAIKRAGYKNGKDVALAMDPAANEFYKDGKYILKTENLELTSTEMVAYYKNLIEKYPIISIEDGLAEDDWDGFKLMVKELGDKIQIVGDDLFVTNIERLQKGINEKAANSILIKLNQIGTLTETLEAINIAKKNDFTSIISHRSGETEDTTISDLAVGLSTKYIKAGSLCRSERTAKYNQLLRIEEKLGDKAIYNGGVAKLLF